MNDWVYAGFDETYKALGVGFDKIYYERDTYLEGINVKWCSNTCNNVFTLCIC